jgi:hypothetical protein
LGHGPYAIEQVRTALEHEAAHAMILVRRHGLCCPSMVDYLNLVRPFTDDFAHPKDGSGMVVTMWRKIYSIVHATPPETWKRGVFRPDGPSVSVSDIYFVGHHLGLINTEVATIRSFHRDGVETRQGTHHKTSVVLKCIGFQINEGNERLLGRATMRLDGAVEDGLFAVVEPHLDERANLLPLIGQVNAINWTAKYILQSVREFIHAGPSMHVPTRTTRARLNHITASEAT